MKKRNFANVAVIAGAITVPQVTSIGSSVVAKPDNNTSTTNISANFQASDNTIANQKSLVATSTFRFFNTNEYEIEADGFYGTIYLSPTAKESVLDPVYIELPEIGSHFHPGDTWFIIESLKTVIEFTATSSVVIEDVNYELMHDPNLINSMFSYRSWIIKVRSVLCK